jgi:RNA polymerase sigma-70 factor, ECF subfamily
VVSLSEDDVAAAVRGEPAALRQAYEALAPAVLGFLRIRGSDDPEGLMQDVFVALLPRLRRLKGGLSGLRTLTFSIAHARLVDELRQRGRRPRMSSYEPEMDPRSMPSAEHQVLSAIEFERLAELLAGLDENMRLAVTLRLVGQLSLEETANVMGKSVGAVKQLQRRGLQALRVKLDPSADVTSRPARAMTPTTNARHGRGPAVAGGRA